ncbi:MAG: SRPBCC family protein [Bacteroidota bacterium]
MKYQGSIEIAKSREEVVKCFADPNCLGAYQDGFVRKELISGEASKDGAVSKIVYQYGNRDMILTETIIANNLPDSFESQYHHKHMDNLMSCQFISLDATRTKYEYEFEYTRINWIMPKLLAILFPSVYRKQGEKWIQQFKVFVENQV